MKNVYKQMLYNNEGDKEQFCLTSLPTPLILLQ